MPAAEARGSEKPIAAPRGTGGYSHGPFSANDHLATYLESILRFLGIGDIEIIRAEGVAYGPEQDLAAMASASERIREASAAA